MELEHAISHFRSISPTEHLKEVIKSSVISWNGMSLAGIGRSARGTSRLGKEPLGQTTNQDSFIYRTSTFGHKSSAQTLTLKLEICSNEILEKVLAVSTRKKFQVKVE